MKVCPICDFQFEDDVKSCPRHNVELTSVRDAFIGMVLREKYKITEMIGKGAMGVVYKAVERDSLRPVAIKILHTHLASNRESLKRFHHEAKAASRLQHPHIVAVFDVGVIPDGQPYIAMEYLSGSDLATYLKRKRFLSTEEAGPIMRQTCEALAEAHSHGVVHRDIKPANIMLLNRFGQENYVVVVDFSIAKVIQKVSDGEATTPGLVFGSPAYMSPERFMGKGGDFRSDIYSMGIIMFQMFAGQTPFRAGDLYSMMNEHVKVPPPTVRSIRPESDISPALEEVIARALAKRPEDRQENMKQLLSELNDALNQRYVLSTAKTSVELEEMAAQSEPVEAPPPPIFDFEAQADPHSIPSFPRLQAQPQPVIEEAPPQAKLSSELAGTGNFDKSLIARNQVLGERTNRAPTPTIRPPAREHVALGPYVLIVAILIGMIFMFVNLPKGPMGGQAAALLNQGKLDEAGHVLQLWRNEGVKKEAQEEYDKLCLRLAKEYGKAKRYQSAVVFAEQVSPKSKLSQDAKALSRQYRKLVKQTLSAEQKP